MIKKITMAMITLSFVISAFSVLHAEDYPSGYLGNGYRGYLSQKTQDGYHIEVFTKIDMRVKERVDKGNTIQELINTSYQAGPESSEGISTDVAQQQYNFDTLKTEIDTQRKQRINFASTNIEGGFNYVPYSDGSVQYFKDGLLVAIQNEGIADEFGNISRKNTFNMEYNDNRLMISYDATLADNSGNTSRISWYGATYTDDSVFYGTRDTVANKHLNQYSIEETDSAGNMKTTHWNALSYEGKALRAYSQAIEDSVYGNESFTRSNIIYANSDLDHISSYQEEGIGTNGLAYTQDRTNITYNDKKQVTGYHDVLVATQLDGCPVTTITDAQFEYLSVPNKFGKDVEEPTPDVLLTSTIKTTTSHLNGSVDNKTAIIKYDYDENKKLVGASGESVLDGQESQWYELTDAQGHNLTANKLESGEIAYSYLDSTTGENIIVPENQIIVTLKDGARYNGFSKTEYEIIQGRPMVKQEGFHTAYSDMDNVVNRIEDSTIVYNNGLVNNLAKVLSSQEHKETIEPPLDDPERRFATIKDIATAYFYDDKGNVLDAVGQGTGSGYEHSEEKGWILPYNSTITVDYKVILGKVLKTDEIENRDY